MIRTRDAHVAHGDVDEDHALRARESDVPAVGEKAASWQHMNVVIGERQLGRGGWWFLEWHFQAPDHAGCLEPAARRQPSGAVVLFELERLGGEGAARPELEAQPP